MLSSDTPDTVPCFCKGTFPLWFYKQPFRACVFYHPPVDLGKCREKLNRNQIHIHLGHMPFPSTLSSIVRISQGWKNTSFISTHLAFTQLFP